MIDALCQITGTTEQYWSIIPEPYTFMPENQRATALADASITSPFLEKFGRSSRDTGMESDRNTRPTAAQRLHLLNSSHIRRKFEIEPQASTAAAIRRQDEKGDCPPALSDDSLAVSHGRRAEDRGSVCSERPLGGAAGPCLGAGQ